MDAKETIEIRLTGHKGNVELSPDQYDISDVKQMLDHIEMMLFPESSRKRPTISYRIEEGSVVHQFQTDRQVVVGFDAVLNDIKEKSSIDILSPRSALAFEHMQQIADENNYLLELTTSVSDQKNPFVISPDTTWKRSKNIWVEAEFYFYGELTNAGGKNKSNIHLDTKTHGTLIIQTDKEYLKEIEKNLLYRPYGVRVHGKQQLQTGEVDTQSLKLIELVDIQKKYDQDYLDKLISRATPKWENVEAEDWLDELRGDYD